MYPEFGYGQVMGRSFRECLGGFAACGLLRENFPHHPTSPEQSEYHGIHCLSKRRWYEN